MMADYHISFLIYVSMKNVLHKEYYIWNSRIVAVYCNVEIFVFTGWVKIQNIILWTLYLHPPSKFKIYNMTIERKGGNRFKLS